MINMLKNELTRHDVFFVDPEKYKGILFITFYPKIQLTDQS